jgi:MYXO-CTERM domain-containing protein
MMDFIERWFGISPDGGSGTTEALYLIAFFAAVGLLLYLWRRRISSSR